MYTAFRGF
uniref:Uncharacterized protein n=1 Tax=Anguilla anguilla TaxID=7936 RepID=A0A0E9RJE2_ANGAN